MIEKKIKITIQDRMNQEYSDIAFESIWKESQKRTQRDIRSVYKMSKKKFAIIAVAVLTIMATTVSAEVARRIDDISYTFKQDQEAVGTWKTIDFVETIESFNPDKVDKEQELYLQELTFCSNGDLITVSEEERGRITTNHPATWTKGHIINYQEELDSAYSIKNIEGKTYMFYEWKNGDYVYNRIDKPYLYVLERDKEAAILESAPPRQIVKRDDTNIAFEDNEAMKGTWVSVDFVEEIEDFNPDIRQTYNLFLKQLVLEEDGKVTNIYRDSGVFSSARIYWSKDVIVNKMNETVSKCIIQNIDGSTYMFYEWKSGDYSYSGAKPLYYVLKKQ